MFFFFFFKQKTAYEMRISDWSSDVCSSDLVGIVAFEDAMGAAHRHCEEYSWGEGNMGLDRDIGGDQDKGSRQENQGASELRRTVRYQRHQRDAGNEAENQDRKSTRLNSSH